MNKKNQTIPVTIYKTVEISAAHKLSLPYESKCNRLHGHNFKIEVWITGYPTEFGMVIDFNEIKKKIMHFDHTNLNELIDPSTAENLAIEIMKKISGLPKQQFKSIKVRVWETRSAYAETKIDF